MPDAPFVNPKDAGKGEEGIVKYWRTELDLASRHEADWRKRGKKVVERYRDEKKRAGKQFNILWSNTETLKPAVYSATPEPDVRRRHLDDDPVGKEAAETLERALSFLADGGDFDEDMEAARDDMLLPGRGVLRVVLESDIQTRAPISIQREDETEPAFFLDDEPVVPDGEDANGNAFVEQIGEQTVRTEYVAWDDFRIFPAGVRRWRDAYGIGFKHVLTRTELVDQFGAIGKSVPLNFTMLKGEEKDKEHNEPLKRAVVWEIWDKRSRQRLWTADGFDKLVDREDDPLGLRGFFPTPAPLYAISTTDTMVPIPEFTIYQDQADELDEITARIALLIKAIKVRGLYAAAIKEFRDLLQGEDNELLPVEDWASMRDRGGLEGAVTWMPIEQIAKVLVSLYQQRELLKQEIFEITGLSDLIRGSTNASETATAQRLKGNFGQFRMTPRQKPVARYARDLFRIMAEIVAEHFTQDNLVRMTGMQLPSQDDKVQAKAVVTRAEQAGQPVPAEIQQMLEKSTWEDVMQLLRDDKTRGFRIDIETDSTVQPDADQERQAATEFTAAVTQFLTTAIEVVGAEPALAKVMGEMLKMSVRRFKVGRTVEDAIDEALLEIEQKAQQPRPDPEAEAAQAETARKDQESQAGIERKQQESVASLAMKRESMQAETALKQQEAQIAAILKFLEAKFGAEIESFKARQQTQGAQNG
jgi:hypothetical protein